MATSDTGNNQTRKPSPYRLALIIGLAGVLLLVLGFVIPGFGWLAWIGLVLLIIAVFTTRISFFGDWAPTLLSSDKKDDLPPPPTVEP